MRYGKAYEAGTLIHESADSEMKRSIALSNTELDEVVLGKFFHLEQMDDNVWWMSVGGVTINVRVNRDGEAVHVMVELDDPQDGCTYAGAVGDE